MTIFMETITVCSLYRWTLWPSHVLYQSKLCEFDLYVYILVVGIFFVHNSCELRTRLTYVSPDHVFLGDFSLWPKSSTWWKWYFITTKQTRVVCFHYVQSRWLRQTETFSLSLALCGYLPSHRWSPHTKASDAELWCFHWSEPEQRIK